ncbi:TolC family outer membrane protein [Enterovibrio sp. ZSDZ35]|uniref:TolC family outer membrane protein n=1 Tax=Enterovibrio qingdaonensis TaxID=2899818 RepID=A0ABT5QHL1_9GAMM|nr:TolC family outer membrane protein [Enterovibrio sp. ZSDZ35]MDD1780457.1 TolC family outer membrane protein [Enterovibrio sp. ZSDZ35]
MHNTLSITRLTRRIVWSLPVALAIPAVSFSQSLEQAVANALTSSPEVRRTFNAYKAQQEQIGQAFSGFLPTVDITAAYGWEQTDSPSTRAGGRENDSLNPGEAGISIRQVLFSGFQTQNEVERSKAEETSAYWRLISVSEEQALKTVKVYIKYIQAKEVVSLSEENLKSHKTIYGQIKEKTDSGLGSAADLYQITGRLARAKSNVIVAKNNLMDAKSNFVRVVNLSPENLIPPVPDADFIPPTLQQTLSAAQKAHPTLKISNSDILAAQYQHDAAKSAYSPEVSLEINGGWDNDIGGTLGHDNDIQAMLRVRYNLYNGGRDTAFEKEMAYRIGESRDVNQTAVRDVIEGATLAWNARINLVEQLGYLKEHVISARQTQSAYTLQFSLGQRTLIDLLDSENEVFESKKDYIAAEYDLLVADYRILNATGNLLSSLRVQPPVNSAPKVPEKRGDQK